MDELNYTTQEILNQQFKTKMRGYDPEEVDEYLDNIIRDYEAMQKEILALQEENDHLQAQVEKLQKISSAKPQEAAQPKSATVTNFDILKRLSNLEREVFGSKLGADNENGQPAPRRAFVEPEVDKEATRLF
ncbi:DivIVA domain-containing protein [Pilibacter termitis]|uniref:DivIVA domain-containing protein n=1 Tax=Pilibacter termitis TaxID=263852 RepID=A0A1T4R6N0_9ENTE|nr:cell division regulator GpsB [Pilibacter termitis]SKA11328.1 DivIVA domain-containing protein [Pilibacter termitis]